MVNITRLGGRLSFLFLLSFVYFVTLSSSLYFLFSGFVYCVTLSSCQGDAAGVKEEIQTHQDVRHQTQHEEWGVPGVKSNTKHNVLFYIYTCHMCTISKNLSSVKGPMHWRLRRATHMEEPENETVCDHWFVFFLIRGSMVQK